MGFIDYSSYKKIFLAARLKSTIYFNKFVYSNSVNVPKIFINTKILVYNGRYWNKKFINRYMVGFKVGEFIWTRKIAIFKNKQKKKKRKK